jgi:outer membrane beta-barrel protein
MVVSSASWAKEDIEHDVAVRHKVEMRADRFEITPTFEGSIGADFRHTVAGGAKLEYHLTDTISIGGLILFGTSFNTGLMDEIEASLPGTQTASNPTPAASTAADHANDMPLHGGLGITLTPWFGKLSLFQKVFVNYDIYVSGGFGFAQTKNSFSGSDNATVCDAFCNDPDPTKHVFNDPRNDGPHNAGFNPGVQVGGGIHFYFNRWLGLDVSIRDYFFTDNPSGLDFNADLKVDGSDRRFMGHLFVGVGISMYLPPNAKISR